MEDYNLIFKGVGVAFVLLFVITACFAPISDAITVAAVGGLILFIVLNVVYFIIDRSV